ncbi:hypothetical protein J3R30DRAFT_415172 [Lentinula aciculospora]|uniref:Uncharacterized protein n=1 Tax=Lentinula aciculospora TaxID=153920 RepID=A0A9W9DMK6_9AGAR|nr:hypothetical protein J3R30DRAFT_415172 [Lentinula aciculospora]
MDNPNLHDSPASLTIGSPRMISPRSHRTHRSVRPHRLRTQDPIYGPNNPIEVRDADQLPTAENLHADYSTFNVDPDAPVLGAGGDIQEAIRSEEERNEIRREKNFVGGFVVGLKRALIPTWNRKQPSDPEAAYTETPYRVDDTSLYAQDPADIERQQQQQQVYPHAESSYRSPSSESQLSPSSETIHGTQELPDDGTTAVDHRSVPMSMPVPTPGHYVSPILVEPELAPDYAKMGSPASSTSEVSLNSYMSRIAHFFQHINELPWVADSRVTVDYYPGQSKRRVRARPAHRKVLSWYNRHAFPPGKNAESLDLNAGSPSPASGQVLQMAEAQSISKEPQDSSQPLILPTIPVPESQIDSAPTYLAELIPPPPPRSETQHSARTGRSVVYSVVNPSAPSSSTSTTTASPLTEPPRHFGIDAMTALAQSTTGYTPFQPSASQYGHPIHDPPTQVPMAPSVVFTGGISQVPPAHTRAGTPAQSMYPYPLYAPPSTT